MSMFMVNVKKKTLQHGKLEIPQNFVSQNGRSLENELVVLKVGNSERDWEVRLEREDGPNGKKVFLNEGWKAFEDHYSIKSDHVLLFTCRGNSTFQVKIFGTNALEISYPTESNPIVPHIHIHHSDSDSESSSVQILETPPRQSATEGSKRKRTRTDRATATEKARAFNSKNHFFWITLPQTYVEHRYMNIPKEFMENHLGDIESADVILKNSKGRTWKVRYLNKLKGNKMTGKLVSGWNKFARDNNLQIGHVCVFELTKKKTQQISFQVHVFPSS